MSDYCIYNYNKTTCDAFKMNWQDCSSLGYKECLDCENRNSNCTVNNDILLCYW